MTTTTVTETLQAALDQANPNKLADALALVKLGTLLTPLKRTFTGTTGPAIDLTATDAVGEVTGASNPNRLPVLAIVAINVTAGAAATGSRKVADESFTADANTLALSDDGKTITFEAGVTDFVIEYIPRSYTDMTSAFANA